MEGEAWRVERENAWRVKGEGWIVKLRRMAWTVKLVNRDAEVPRSGRHFNECSIHLNDIHVSERDVRPLLLQEFQGSSTFAFSFRLSRSGSEYAVVSFSQSLGNL